MFCIHSPPVSRSTAKLHENQQPLWCCFGLSWKRKIKRWLCFFIYFVQRLTVGGNGRITVACWCIVTTANKNLAVNCGEVASQTYGILQYKNLLMAQYRCLRCSNMFVFFCVFYWIEVQLVSEKTFAAVMEGHLLRHKQIFVFSFAHVCLWTPVEAITARHKPLLCCHSKPCFPRVGQHPVTDYPPQISGRYLRQKII